MNSSLHVTPPLLGNHLLDALLTDAGKRLQPHWQLVSLERKRLLHSSGDVVHQVYFPTDSIVSLVYEMQDGASADISMVGNDGVVGVATFMGSDNAQSHAIVHTAGYAYRLGGRRIRDEFDRCDGVLALLLRYMQSLMTQVAQAAACIGVLPGAGANAVASKRGAEFWPAWLAATAVPRAGGKLSARANRRC